MSPYDDPANKDHATVNTRPIGIIDSGIGGMSVTREIRRLLPHEALLYLADTAMLPYGDKSPSLIRQRLLALGEWLHAVQRIKMLVIACNTATAAAAGALRRTLPIPVIGMEPAVKPAANVTRNRRIGVLATEGTLKSARFAGLLRTFASGLHVYTQPCPGLVEAIEADDRATIQALLVRYLKPLRQHQIDTLVLGCTHYPLVRPAIERIAGPDLRIIDTGQAVARHTAHQLAQLALRNTQPHSARFLAGSTGDPAAFLALLKRLFPEFRPTATLTPPRP